MNAHRSDTAYFLRDVIACASVLLVATIAACSSSDNSGSDTSANSTCKAGTTVACACADGTTGSQTCGASTCTCSGHDSGSSSGVDASTGGGEDASTGGEDAGEDTGNPMNGDGGHVHDASPPPPSDAAAGYGATCAVDKDCTDAVYNVCFVGGQKSICSKKCTTNNDCPNPPTSGTCNNKGFCK